MVNEYAPTRENLELAVIAWGEDISLGYHWAESCKEDSEAYLLYNPGNMEEKAVRDRMITTLIAEYGNTSAIGLLIRYPFITGNVLSANALKTIVRIFSSAFRKALKG